MDFIYQLLLLIGAGIFSGAVITSIMFYRQIKHGKTADTGLTLAETKEVRARTDILTVEAFGDAIDLLGKENKRLSQRQGELQEELGQLRAEVRRAVIDNALLATQLERLRVILLDFQKGILILTHQVVQANLKPAYTIPDYVAELLKTEAPAVEGSKG